MAVEQFQVPELLLGALQDDPHSADLWLALSIRCEQLGNVECSALALQRFAGIAPKSFQRMLDAVNGRATTP